MIGANVPQSRLTFRDKADDVCWQKQLRDKYLAEGAPPVPYLELKRAIVRPVTRHMAEHIILKYEWLGTLPNCSFYFGIFFGDYCAGVTCVGVGGGGANVYAYKEFGLLAPQELAYLMRGANVHWSPPGANSKLVSWTCKLLARASKAKIIIAYSDTDAGEIGTIYQACNWVCIGRGSSTRQWIAPNGRIFDQKLPYDMRRKDGFKLPRQAYVKALRAAGWTEQASNPKYRYVQVLDQTDKALVARVEHMRRPYPKRERAAEAIEDAAGDQPEKGGASPTLPLHTE